MRIATAFCFAAFWLCVSAVDRNNFKTCEQSGFCKRCRTMPHNKSPYSVAPSTLNIYSDSVTFDIKNKDNGISFVVKVEGVKHDIFRVLIDEKTPLHPRYRVADTLKGPVVPDTIKVTEEASKVILTAGTNKAVIHAEPFTIDFYKNDVLFVTTNAKGLLRVEHLRKKRATQYIANISNYLYISNGLKWFGHTVSKWSALFYSRENNGENVDENEVNDSEIKLNDETDDMAGAWEEEFKSHHDSKPNGPEAVALDFTFPQAQVLFGIPEHADSFALKSTIGSEPYRMYNLDVFEYELDSTMAIYGAVPVLYGHGTAGTAGVFWLNSAETWVDIYNRHSEKGVLSSIVNAVSGDEPLAGHFMSESGIVDVFILLGSTPLNTFKLYTDLTGVAPLPQHFALAYHQSRWNYNDQTDVNTVSANFDVHDIPMDTMWLDIEYTDGKKYFTWDQHKFPQPKDMIKNLTDLGRHLTIIIDPHIKRDNHYFFHNDCSSNGYYTNTKDGHVYEGWCWPGSVSYPDLFREDVRKYFADQYQLDKFTTTTADVAIWNDMNEPSVFNGPEVTMPKDCVHQTYMGAYEHRVVHNQYAHMQLMSTFEGLTRRSDGKLRPFILTRGHYAGSQRYAAMWTGDNFADWKHLAISLKMCLSEAVGGISFCGADVGGFFGNPEPELYERWYQAGAFQPFFRAHSHIDTRRREPWLMPEPTKLVVREAIRKRYTYLPYWYTLFYEHEQLGYPVMRPLLAHYPHDAEAFSIDNEYLLGQHLLVRPVLEPSAKSVDVYFPRSDRNGESDLWYDIDDLRVYNTAGYVTVPVDSYKIPVYQRGGSIVPRKMRVRRSSPLMKNDPYTIVVCLDKNKKANGTLYADDEKSYEYRNGNYIYTRFDFKDTVLSYAYVGPRGNYQTPEWIERIVVAGLGRTPKKAVLHNVGTRVDLDIILKDASVDSFIVRKPGVNIDQPFTMSFEF